MSDLGATASTPTPAPPSLDDEQAPPRPPSIWPHVENQILDLISEHRSSIVFANSRRLAERLTAHLNELNAERLGEVADPFPPPAQVMAQSGASSGRDGSHGPSSPERTTARSARNSVPRSKTTSRQASCRALWRRRWSSGSIWAPSMSWCKSRLHPRWPAGCSGSAGPGITGATSRGVFFPNHRGDLIASAVVVERMRQGAIEEVAELRNPLDVLAQQIVAIVSIEDAKAEELYALVRRASSFRQLPYSAFEAVLDMLSGRYPSEQFAELRPRLIWHRDTGCWPAVPEPSGSR